MTAESNIQTTISGSSKVNLANLVGKNGYIPNLNSQVKIDAISELLEALIESGRVPGEHQDEIFQGLLAREELGSTGIGRGVAVPHAKHESMEKPVGIVGRSEEGIDFQALDGQSVDLVFLVVSPVDNEQRLAALKQVSLFVKHMDLCRFLREASDSKEAYEIFQEAENRLHEVE